MKNSLFQWVLAAGTALVFAAAPPDTLRGKVVKIIDGDTVDLFVKAGEKPKRIRLYGIDAPEHDQPFGKRAKEFAADFSGMKVAEVVVRDIDRYGRVVGEVRIDGVSLNRELVRNGYAWWYKQYASKDTLLQGAEREAQEAKIGLWSDPHPTPPWKWRAEKRNKGREKR